CQGNGFDGQGRSCAVERRVAADEAGASVGASPLNAVFDGPWRGQGGTDTASDIAPASQIRGHVSVDPIEGRPCERPEPEDAGGTRTVRVALEHSHRLLRIQASTGWYKGPIHWPGLGQRLLEMPSPRSGSNVATLLGVPVER